MIRGPSASQPVRRHLAQLLAQRASRRVLAERRVLAHLRRDRLFVGAGRAGASSARCAPGPRGRRSRPRARPPASCCSSPSGSIAHRQLVEVLERRMLSPHAGAACRSPRSSEPNVMLRSCEQQVVAVGGEHARDGARGRSLEVADPDDAAVRAARSRACRRCARTCGRRGSPPRGRSSCAGRPPAMGRSLLVGVADRQRDLELAPRGCASRSRHRSNPSCSRTIVCFSSAVDPASRSVNFDDLIQALLERERQHLLAVVALLDHPVLADPASRPAPSC